MQRRAFLTGLASGLVAAPSVVRAVSLMPIRGIIMPVDPSWATDIVGPFRYVVLYDPAGSEVASWDYGSSCHLTAGDTFTVDNGLMKVVFEHPKREIKHPMGTFRLSAEQPAGLA